MSITGLLIRPLFLNRNLLTHLEIPPTVNRPQYAAKNIGFFYLTIEERRWENILMNILIPIPESRTYTITGNEKLLIKLADY